MYTLKKNKVSDIWHSLIKKHLKPNGNYLKDLKKQGWSQERIANHCKVTQAAINQLNIGKSREPRHSLGENLIKLATLQSSAEIH